MKLRLVSLNDLGEENLVRSISFESREDAEAWLLHHEQDIADDLEIYAVYLEEE